MYPADLVPFLLANGWIAGLAFLVGAFLGRVFPRTLPYAILAVGLGVSAYFAWMIWLLEGTLWIPLGFFAIAGLGSLFLSAAVRYVMAAFEAVLFWVGWYLVVTARLAAPWASPTVDGGLAFLVALACVAATEPLTRWVIRRTTKAPETGAPATGARPTAA